LPSLHSHEGHFYLFDNYLIGFPKRYLRDIAGGMRTWDVIEALQQSYIEERGSSPPGAIFGIFDRTTELFCEQCR